MPRRRATANVNLVHASTGSAAPLVTAQLTQAHAQDIAPHVSAPSASRGGGGGGLRQPMEVGSQHDEDLKELTAEDLGNDSYRIGDKVYDTKGDSVQAQQFKAMMQRAAQGKSASPEARAAYKAWQESQDYEKKEQRRRDEKTWDREQDQAQWEKQHGTLRQEQLEDIANKNKREDERNAVLDERHSQERGEDVAYRQAQADAQAQERAEAAQRWRWQNGIENNWTEDEVNEYMSRGGLQSGRTMAYSQDDQEQYDALSKAINDPNNSDADKAAYQAKLDEFAKTHRRQSVIAPENPYTQQREEREQTRADAKAERDLNREIAAQTRMDNRQNAIEDREIKREELYENRKLNYQDRLRKYYSNMVDPSSADGEKYTADKVEELVARDMQKFPAFKPYGAPTAGTATVSPLTLPQGNEASTSTTSAGSATPDLSAFGSMKRQQGGGASSPTPTATTQTFTPKSTPTKKPTASATPQPVATKQSLDDEMKELYGAGFSDVFKKRLADSGMNIDNMTDDMVLKFAKENGTRDDYRNMAFIRGAHRGSDPALQQRVEERKMKRMAEQERLDELERKRKEHQESEQRRANEQRYAGKLGWFSV